MVLGVSRWLLSIRRKTVRIIYYQDYANSLTNKIGKDRVAKT